MNGAVAALNSARTGASTGNDDTKDAFAQVTNKVDEAKDELGRFEAAAASMVCALSKDSDDRLHTLVNLGLFALASAALYSAQEYIASDS